MAKSLKSVKSYTMSFSLSLLSLKYFNVAALSFLHQKNSCFLLFFYKTL